MKVFSANANRPLAQKIADYLGMSLGDAEISHFSDGEISVKYNENIRGADVFIVQPTSPPADHLLELLLMIDAAKRASAKRITAVIPYFGYARQDRKDQPRVALSAKLVANLISVAGTDRVLTMDLHSPSIQGFFDIPFDHLSRRDIRRLSQARNCTIRSSFRRTSATEKGQGLCEPAGIDFAIVDKKRVDPNAVESVTLIGQVEDRDVILVDDMIDTAGTLCAAAGLMKKVGAKRVIAACTHPILSGNSVANIESSPLSRLVVSDTLLVPEEKLKGKIEVLTAASLFGEAIKRIHNEESISSLFKL
jgi:ribose-phosphate pyrophosphokinase